MALTPDSRLPRRFERYVAIGDSSTAGLDDPDGSGGYQGWSRRLAWRLASLQGSLRYANLGVIGWTTRQILTRQLAPALALKPDLATVFAGTNDVVALRFDAHRVARDMETMQRELVAGGATVLTFTLPDLAPVMPLARLLTPRIRALNQGLRTAAARSGAILVDFARYPVGSDPRLWSEDRIHANAQGHARIACALGHALGLPGHDDSWSLALPETPPRTRREWLAAELRWMGRHLLPWIGSGLRPRALREPRERESPALQHLVPRPL